MLIVGQHCKVLFSQVAHILPPARTSLQSTTVWAWWCGGTHARMRSGCSSYAEQKIPGNKQITSSTFHTHNSIINFHNIFLQLFISDK